MIHASGLRVGASRASARARALGTFAALAALLAACTHTVEERPHVRGRAVVPGITVLLDDSIGLVRGKRVGLLTNQTGIDAAGVSDIELLRGDRARAAGVRLVALFSPEHGIRGTEDRSFVQGGKDERSGLPIYSLYGASTIAPPDSLLRALDVLVFDLPDIGTRTWTYVGAMVYALRAGKRTGVPIVVLDRPAPLGGVQRDGPMLDSALANPEEPTAQRAGQAYALWPFPLRHGMTMGEMARYYNSVLGIDAPLRVVPMRRWRRAMWADETGLAWVNPSPSMTSVTSALIYPGLVAFEASNVSVGRGTAEPFQRFGAPWMDAKRVAGMLNDRGLNGVKFEAERFTPNAPGDGKYAGREVPGVHVVLTDRSRVHTGRLAAAILWAISRAHPDSLRLEARAFDLRWGYPAGREAILRGEDPDAVVDRTLGQVVEFDHSIRPFLLYD